MPKHDFLTPKAIANRIKSKGLQKLRWYCQVCQKQCRDENGFKCHTTSESHQRQMLLVAKNPTKFVSGYSEMFENGFLDLLRRRHGTKRMRANTVYNEYIADKTHIHMNSTKWTTLSGFVQYLGKSGKCVVDETEKGWYIQYINRDPKLIPRQNEMERKKRSVLDHEERTRRFLEKQVKEANELETHQNKNSIESSNIVRDNPDNKISLTLQINKKLSEKKIVSNNIFNLNSSHDESNKNNDNKVSNSSTNRTTLDEIMESEIKLKHTKNNKRKQRINESSENSNIKNKIKKKKNWISKYIIVKIIDVKSPYYKLKGLIIDIVDKYFAKIQIIDDANGSLSKKILIFDQEELETVIPNIGKRVKILNGEGRGKIGKLLNVDINKYCASILVENGSFKDQVLDNVDYEDISKLDEESYTNRKN